MPTIPDKCTAPFLASEEDAKPYSITFHWHVPHDGGSDIQFYTLIWATNMRFQGFKARRESTDTSYTLDNVEPNLFLGRDERCRPGQVLGLHPTSGTRGGGHDPSRAFRAARVEGRATPESRRGCLAEVAEAHRRWRLHDWKVSDLLLAA
ncbi:unnamed protein product [Durusdinium trenchii]|uniref:Uncharacterized protein n=1 Tax=Durusdinium trenchii TaxID=1381693 RepID=A0ABP0KU36_9DINO